MSMQDTAPQPLRKKIDESQVDEWRNEALALFRHGNREAVVVEYLKERRCPPRIRDLVIAEARGAGRIHHRGAGVRALGLGGALWVGAALLCYLGVVGVPAGGGYVVHSGRLIMIGLGLFVGGLAPVGLGLFKTLTGSAVAVEVADR